MGDRLTLETAAFERVVGVLVEAAVTAVVRSRADIPRDYTVPREQLARLVHFILTPDSEQRAYCLDPVGTIASVDAAIAEIARLRGPTEGASDAATEKALRDLGSSDVGTVFDVRMEYGSGKSRVWEYMGRHPQPGSPDAYRFKDERGEFAHLNHPDWRLVRPPTGEASPDTDGAGVWEKRSRAYRKCADKFQAQRDEVEAKLAKLTGAVKSPTPAPQVPDSPGWWWLDAFGDGKWAPVRVWRSASNSTLWTRRDVRLDEELVDAGDDWGGRCTRDAPEAPVVGMRVCAKCESDTCPGRDALDDCTMRDAPDAGLRARVEAAWAAFEIDDGFDGSLRGAQLADRLRKALDGS